MHRFYLVMTCDNCGTDIYLGPNGTTIERNGLPVIPFDFAAQETFECDCGATHVTGDFEYLTEFEPPDEDEEGEDPPAVPSFDTDGGVVDPVASGPLIAEKREMPGRRPRNLSPEAAEELGEQLRDEEGRYGPS